MKGICTRCKQVKEIAGVKGEDELPCCESCMKIPGPLKYPQWLKDMMMNSSK